MKLGRFLTAHKWSVRIVVLASLLAVFGVIELQLLGRDSENARRVAESEYQASVSSSKAIQAHKQRQEAAKKDEEARKKADEAAKTATTKTPPSIQSTGGPHRNPASIDVVVNKKNPLVPLTYAPSVVTVSCAGQGSIVIATQVNDDLAALCQAAVEAGVPLSASSAYRSYSYQVTVYNRWVAQSGQAQADTFSARPGYSEHQTGFAIDFSTPGGATLNNFTGTAQQKWLAANGPSYGFIQRYTEANVADTGYVAESWHYRYIGRENARAYTAAGAISLERFWGIAGGDY